MSDGDSRHLPTGTVTFLYTDIEASTRRWEQNPEAMKTAHERHDSILRGAIEGNNGIVFRIMGDAFCGAFHTAPDAVEAALKAQRALYAEQWGEDTGSLRVRMSIHTGIGELGGGDYVGPPLNRVARLLSAGYGGQVLLSQPTYELVRDALPAGITLRDMGEHRLKDLQRPEHIYQLVAPDLPSDFPTLKTLDMHPNNLPMQTTPLIGREKEAASAGDTLLRPDVRLLTLTGPGGVGKTRVGLQVAADLLDEFDDGVFLVSLAPISDPHLVEATIAQTLGVREAGGRSLADSLQDYLRDKSILLMLDNFEQIVESAPVVGNLISGAAHLKVIVTSREALHLKAEHEFPIPPLSAPNPKSMPLLEGMTQYEAVRLFIERAQAVKPDFMVTNENAPAIAEICYKLDGMPLAIELAAARIRLLPPQAMLSRLESRLKLLTGGARDIPARQQTLRGTIEWSYDLLDPGEQILFRRLSIFGGGCTLETIDAVVGDGGKSNSQTLSSLDIDVLEGVESLISKSLLRQEETRSGEPRFFMFGTIREYGLERLDEAGEAEALGQRHAEYFLELAERAEPKLTTRQQLEWLDQLDPEHDNLRAAIEWCISRPEHVQMGLLIAGALSRFWSLRSYFSDGRMQLEAALAAAPARTAARAKALCGLGNITFLQGDAVTTRALGHEALSISQELGDELGTAWALAIMGMPAGLRGDLEGVALLQQSSTLFRKLGDKWGLALTLVLLGYVALRQGDQAEVGNNLGESVKLFRETGDRWGIGMTLMGQALQSMQDGDYGASRARFEESLALYEELGDKWGITSLAEGLGYVAEYQGDFEGALQILQQGLVTSNEIGYKIGIASILIAMGIVERSRGNYERAVELMDEALAQVSEPDNKEIIANIQSNKAKALLYQKDYRAAQILFIESMNLFEAMNNRRGIAECLAGLAGHALGIGQPERAARLLGVTQTIFEAMSITMDPNDRKWYDSTTEEARIQLGEAAFSKAFETGQAMTLEEAMAFALEELGS